MSTVCLYDITNEKLGKGHFAVVKLAKHCLTGELVAVKIIDKLRLNHENLQQLGQEIRLLSRLSEKEHPNIVKLYQVIDTKTKLYLIMEYPGRDVCDLYDFIEKNNTQRSGLNEKVAKHIFRQICSAISYCHSLKIVHRDIKPENILVVNEPEEISSKNRIEYPIVKLIDFGFSNQWNEGEKLRTSCGTLAFSSPEILLNCEYEGDKVDIWGLGCILYILLYRSSPFMQMNDSETLIKILDCSFSTPQRPNVDDNSIQLIRSLLRKDPKSRLTIKQILEHPWLSEEKSSSSETNNTEPQSINQQQKEQLIENKESQLNEQQQQSSILDDEMIELRKKLSSVESYDKSKFFDETLHESVIEQMLTKGMCNSREQVENAIKCSRKIANASKSEIVEKIIPNKDELNDQVNQLEEEKGARDCYNTDNKLINQHLEENSNLVAKEDTEKAYLTATYNLLKDKIYREQQGINLTNQVQNKLIHHKKVLPTRPRKSIIKQPQFGPISTGSSRPESANSCELNETSQIAEEQQNQKFSEIVKDCAGLVNNFKAAELPMMYEEENNGSGFMLPLARKCSIVSEEGSCVGTSDRDEYSSDINSGQNSISNYNSLNDYTNDLNKVRSHSYLNNQNSNSSSKRNSRENLKMQSMPLVNIVITDFSNTIEEDERLEIDEFNNCTIRSEPADDQDDGRKTYFCPTPNSLHQASSSPDLGREEKLSEQPSDLVISKEDEDQNENAFDEHVMNQLNQSTSSKVSLHTSMRVIMQSKSCNNILCSGLSSKEDHCSDCEASKVKKIDEQSNQSSSPTKDITAQFTSETKEQANNLSIFSRIIGKRLQTQKKESTKKRLSLNLEQDDNVVAMKETNKLNSSGFTFRKCKSDKINCCAMS